ncbi:hypothetical protein [Dyadobacter tibetensis]|uniref:hypothetical protein n=1 Tax=Dyadobacter tibetensis TaxID=1211851 RepID=UPI00047008EB|nr:hypothetical protein [Dyadobacter tibetensis]
MHQFHIPVLGLGYSVDTPIKVAHLGISSVISIVDDIMIERMRRYHCLRFGESYHEIKDNAPHFRSKRITAYLDLVGRIVAQKVNNLKSQSFMPGTELTRYFRLLPDESLLKQEYSAMLQMGASTQRLQLEQELKAKILPGSIDVNIMSKVDKLNVNAEGEILDERFSDASAALQGFAQSSLQSSLILSAGMNPRLYGFLETFSDFLPDEKGLLRKKVILKVSDYRSALIQAKYLAKRGIWISEFRIESGLNCGGHAFATEGSLLGPILQEFKEKRISLKEELLSLFKTALGQSYQNRALDPVQKITVQGGIGTACETKFLMDYYSLDGTGWGSPFLLVPEATNVDSKTLQALESAQPTDYYVSDSSPLGVLFNNFKSSSAEKLRLERIARGRPGSPCKKKYLVSNSDFTAKPICTASREYQHLKIKELTGANLPEQDLKYHIEKVTEKLCLCEGLSTAALIKNELLTQNEDDSVAICPGPNLAWFDRSYSLEEMVDHIYGRGDVLAGINRPNLFLNELKLYVEYLRKEVGKLERLPQAKKEKALLKFKEQLLNGISYYYDLIPRLEGAGMGQATQIRKQLEDFAGQVHPLLLPEPQQPKLSARMEEFLQG